MEYYIGSYGIYTGDMVPGDRLATQDEIDEHMAAQEIPPEPPEPETKYTPEERTEFLEGLMEGLGYEQSA